MKDIRCICLLTWVICMNQTTILGVYSCDYSFHSFRELRASNSQIDLWARLVKIACI